MGTQIGSPRCAPYPIDGSPQPLMTKRSGCGTQRLAPRRPALKGTQIGSLLCACYLMDASSLALATKRSGCGMLQHHGRSSVSRLIPLSNASSPRRNAILSLATASVACTGLMLWIETTTGRFLGLLNWEFVGQPLCSEAAKPGQVR
jgi:hypothetical protein